MTSICQICKQDIYQSDLFTIKSNKFFYNYLEQDLHEDMVYGLMFYDLYNTFQQLYDNLIIYFK